MSPSSSISQTSWGEVNGQPVHLYTLQNRNGLIARITNYGATLTELHVPDRDGNLGDVVLGFSSLQQYLGGHPYFGALVGRVANRIARGRFQLDGTQYTLAINNGRNHLHGGIKGFDKKVWEARAEEIDSAPSLTLSCTSPDGEEGYPGELKVTVVYTLTHHDELRIEMQATTSKATPVNLTNHSYWNLAGVGDVLEHEVMLNCDHYTPVDDTLIPTGVIEPVQGTPFDFTRPKTIRRDIAQLPGYSEGKRPGGYDHNFVINGEIGQLRLVARVSEPMSGRVMEVFTTQPGVQFYTGNFLDGSKRGKDGKLYTKHAGLCLETQHYPDSVNKSQFPSCILRPGQRYEQTVAYRFSTRR